MWLCAHKFPFVCAEYCCPVDTLHATQVEAEADVDADAGSKKSKKEKKAKKAKSE